MFLLFTETPIHPPSQSGDPFAVEITHDDLGCIMRMEEGVCHVYRDEGSLEKHEPVEWPYPDRNTFLVDQNIMVALVADGPL